MRRALAVLLAAAGILAVASTAHAAFEDVEVSPSLRATGGAGLAQLADPYAAFHNPASLAWMGRGTAAASYVQPFQLDFASQSVAVAAFHLPGRAGGLGVGWREFGVEYQGVNLTRETTVALAHGFRLLSDRQSQLAFGWALDWYSLDYGNSITGLDPGQATTVGFAVGAMATVRDRTRVGMSVWNLNQPMIGELDKEELRQRMGFGVTYAPYAGVETSLDLVSEIGENLQWRGGTQVGLTDAFFLRAGVRTEPNVITAGLGLKVAGFTVEYGFSSGGGVLDETHQIGLRASLPEAR